MMLYGRKDQVRRRILSFEQLSEVQSETIHKTVTASGLNM
jgi:hypothetical protein